MCFKKRITVEKDFSRLGKYIGRYRHIYVIHDANVIDYAQQVREECGHKLAGTLEINAAESSKTMDSIMRIEQWLMEQNADRAALVLAVGGGVTSDMVGFAASIYKRGIAYANIPTTLLAQVDASVGGKTGVNFNSFKNMLGVTALPAFTYICPKTLETLPRQQFLSGAAEMLKTFLISDRILYTRAVRALSASYTEDLPDLIYAAAMTKSRIVRRDLHDNGPRRKLNFGHTYGHALEWYQQAHHLDRQYTHGEAVAVGMVAAARLSERRGIARKGLVEQIVRDFMACNLPVELPCPIGELETAVSQDKKARDGRLNFVFIRDIGRVKVKKL